jgi:hypothetical protein
MPMEEKTELVVERVNDELIVVERRLWGQVAGGEVVAELSAEEAHELMLALRRALRQ